MRAKTARIPTMQLTKDIRLPRLSMPSGIQLPRGLALTRKSQAADVVGLEIEGGSMAAAEVRLNGGHEVNRTAVSNLPQGLFQEGEVLDQDGLAAAVKAMFADHRLSKRVRLGIANQSVVVRTVRLPAIEDPKELEAAVRFQATEQMPMPLEQAVLEHQVVGGVAAEEGAPPQIDVVLIAARRDMIATFVQTLRKAGLEPVGVDLSAFGMIRALADVAPASAAGDGDLQGPDGATLYCSVGDVINLAVARRRSCLFTRASHAGIGEMVEQLTAARGLTPEHAAMWLSYVGLETPIEQIDGDPAIVEDTRSALETGISATIDELRLSLDYYGAQEGAVSIEQVVLCGPGSAIAGVGGRIEATLGLPVTPARPPALSGMDAATAARLTLPFGLALET